MKGTVLDIVMVIIIAFGLGFSLLIGHLVITEFSTQVSDFESPAGNNFNTTMINRGEDAIKTFNFSFVILIIGLLAATMIGAYMINTHPAIFIVSILLLVIVAIISVPFSNAFYEISRSAELTNATNTLPLMVQVMDYLPEIIIALGVILAIIIYAKYSGGSV